MTTLNIRTEAEPANPRISPTSGVGSSEVPRLQEANLSLTGENLALRLEVQGLREENEGLKARLTAWENFMLCFSHDTKGLLTGPIGYTQLGLRPGSTPERITSSLPIILKGLLDVKNGLIAFPDQLRMAGELKKQPLDIVASLQTVSFEIVNTARKVDEDTMRDLDLRFESPVDSQIINGDSEHLNAAFTDLLINAIQAMAGCIVKQLTISVQPGAKGVSIFIKDTGAGIPVNIKDRIFDKGFTTKADGNGNGLYNVQNRIAAHGGKIKIKETGPCGTTFEVCLPY